MQWNGCPSTHATSSQREQTNKCGGGQGRLVGRVSGLGWLGEQWAGQQQRGRWPALAVGSPSAFYLYLSQFLSGNDTGRLPSSAPAPCSCSCRGYSSYYLLCLCRMSVGLWLLPDSQPRPAPSCALRGRGGMRHLGDGR
jgi:hypothetical protein